MNTRLVALLLCAFAATSAFAGSLRVGPTLIVLDANKPVATLQVRNNNAVTTTIDVQVMRWRQENGQDIYELTDELISTPPVFELPAGESQVVRIGLLNATHLSGVERAYRVFVTETPTLDSPSEARVQTLMRVGVPVFVATGSPRHDLRWRMVRSGEDWLVEVENVGQAHARVLGLVITRDDEFASSELPGVYVLPGSIHRWRSTYAPAMENGRLLVRLREGTQVVPIAPRQEFAREFDAAAAR